MKAWGAWLSATEIFNIPLFLNLPHNLFFYFVVKDMEGETECQGMQGAKYLRLARSNKNSAA